MMRKLIQISAVAMSLLLLVACQAKKPKTPAQENLQAGKQFLAHNAKEKGVVILKSGLQYKILKKGRGVSPKPTDVVTVNYEGKLLNGKVFDSSYARHQPIQFPVQGVIQGWQQALVRMKPGATWMLYIPSNLAYGEQGAGNAIGPNSTLVFKVHLIKVGA